MADQACPPASERRVVIVITEAEARAAYKVIDYAAQTHHAAADTAPPDTRSTFRQRAERLERVKRKLGKEIGIGGGR